MFLRRVILGSLVKSNISPLLSVGRNLSTTVSKMEKGIQKRYKLKYFGFKMLGEPIRWQFVVAGVPFTDERLPRDAWDDNGKQKMGFGRLPILEVNDGDQFEISQSCAISRYLAAEFGQLPETNLLRTRADELVDNLQDFRLSYRPWIRETDESKKAILVEEVLKVHFPFYFPRIEAFIRQHGQNGFAVGGSLSWADFYLANFIQILVEDQGLGKGILEKTPLLLAHMNKIINIPSIKAWNEKRPTTKYKY